MARRGGAHPAQIVAASEGERLRSSAEHPMLYRGHFDLMRRALYALIEPSGGPNPPPEPFSWGNST